MFGSGNRSGGKGAAKFLTPRAAKCLRPALQATLATDDDNSRCVECGMEDPKKTLVVARGYRGFSVIHVITGIIIAARFYPKAPEAVNR